MRQHAAILFTRAYDNKVSTVLLHNNMLSQVLRERDKRLGNNKIIIIIESRPRTASNAPDNNYCPFRGDK